MNTSKKHEKKVLVLVPTLPGGGAERFAVNLANYLANEDFTVTIYNIGHSEELKFLIDLSKVGYIYDPRNSKLDFAPLKRLYQYVKSNEIKYFIFIELFSFFYAKLLTYVYRWSIKSFITFHYTDVRNKKERIQYYLFSRLISRKDKLIAICKYQRKKLLNDNKFPFKEDEIKVIYNGVDTNFFTLPPSDFNAIQVRKELNIPEQSRIIIKVAGFRSEKRHLDAIKALHILHKNFKQQAYLLLAGTGDQDLILEVKSLISELGLDDFVRFLGFQKDVRKYLWISDLFTLTSNTIETFSFAALEALSTGLPIVLTDLGGASEMVITGINGCVVPPNDIESIAKNWNDILNKTFEKQSIASNTFERFYIEKIHNMYKEEINTHIYK